MDTLDWFEGKFERWGIKEYLTRCGANPPNPESLNFDRQSSGLTSYIQYFRGHPLWDTILIGRLRPFEMVDVMETEFSGFNTVREWGWNIDVMVTILWSSQGFLLQYRIAAWVLKRYEFRGD